MQTKHLLYMPLTGLGLYGGHRGNRWLRNRIKIFKQFVLPSLQQQTNKDFTLWVSGRYEDRNDKLFKQLEEDIKAAGVDVVFTFTGVCFWDDKHPDDVARDKVTEAIRGAMPTLLDSIGEADTVLMTIQPSDDIYRTDAVNDIQEFFKEKPDVDCYGYRHGYVMDYINWRLKEWNPTTTPPFYTIKFDREDFVQVERHAKFTGLYKSHEYVKDVMNAEYVEKRMFVVGTHGENISTVFDHPFTGKETTGYDLGHLLSLFGQHKKEPLKLPFSMRKRLMRRLPYGWRRKMRYYLGERLAAPIYEWLRE